MERGQEELFDAYIDRTLPPAERADFEAALAADAGLRDDFELHRSTRELIQIAALKAALGRIQESFLAGPAVAGQPPVSATAERGKGAVRPFYASRTWQAVAAALVLGAGIATWQLTKTTATDTLYAKYYTPDAGLPGLMGSLATYSLDDAMVDYKSGQYSDAITKLEALRKGGTAGDTAVYYLGMAYLGNERYDDGAAELQLLTQKENVFRKKAAWYEALALLKSGRKEEAKAALQAIAGDTDNLKAPAAAKLLAEWPE